MWGDDLFQKAEIEAYKFLAYRPRSKEEIRSRLRKKGYPQEIIEEVVRKLEGLGYINDSQLAFELALSLLKNKRWGFFRIANYLAEKGIPREIASQTLNHLSGEWKEKALIKEIIERRFKDFSPQGASEREKRRVIQHLRQKGFSWEAILEGWGERDDL